MFYDFPNLLEPIISSRKIGIYVVIHALIVAFFHTNIHVLTFFWWGLWNSRIIASWQIAKQWTAFSTNDPQIRDAAEFWGIWGSATSFWTFGNLHQFGIAQAVAIWTQRRSTCSEWFDSNLLRYLGEGFRYPEAARCWLLRGD